MGYGPHALCGYSIEQLLNPSAEPEIVLDLSGVIPDDYVLSDLVLDKSGDLYVATSAYPNNTHPILPNGVTHKFSKSSCWVSGSPLPTISISASPSTPLSSIWTSQQFDKSGSLWVCDTGHGLGFGHFLKYLPETLTSSGSPPADITISIDSSIPSPDEWSFTFDSFGNLWFLVSTVTGQVGVRKIAADDLLHTGTVTPKVIWSGSQWSGQAPYGLTFAPSGFLWVSDYHSNFVRKYDVTDAVSGNQLPVLIISSTSFNGPSGLTFDLFGNLWIANDNDNRFMRFAASDLTTSGSKNPTILLQPSAISYGSVIALADDPLRSGI